MVAAIGSAYDGCSDRPWSSQSPLSLKVLRATGTTNRVASATPRSNARSPEATAPLKRQNPKLRTAWAGDEALWLSDDFLYPVDRHQIREAAVPFPPQHNEAPPDRSFSSHRATVKSRECKQDEESRRLFAHVPVATADISELPRRRRIQLLGGLLAEEKEVLPRHRLEAEIEPMRHVSAGRARCESTVRWGGQRPWPRPATRGKEEKASESPGACWPSLGLLVPGAAPREMFAGHEKSKASELGQVLQQYHARKEAEASEEPRPPRLAAESGEELPANDKFQALLQELQQLNAQCSEHASVSASQCSRMADLGRQLEVRSYDMRFDQLLQALVAVGTAAAHVEAASQPSVTDRLVVREHWRRKHQDLRASAKAMAEAVSAETLTANLASVVSGLKALAQSGTGCQERLDGQLARLKELFRQERVTPLATATIAGAIGQLLLPGPHGVGGSGVYAKDGATPASRCFNVRFMKDLAAMVMEALPDFAEAEFKMMGWVFPTAYLDEGQMRQLLARAAEIQVGLRPLPHCDACRAHLGHVVDFVREKMPRLNATLSEFLQLYCKKVKQSGL